jgi:hypothetical protein
METLEDRGMMSASPFSVTASVPESAGSVGAIQGLLDEGDQYHYRAAANDAVPGVWVGDAPSSADAQGRYTWAYLIKRGRSN